VRNLEGKVAAITGAGRGIGRGMRLPNTAHTSRPWRIHDIAPDFELEDVWALPTPGGPDDFPGWCARCPRADRPSPARPARCGSSGGRPTSSRYDGVTFGRCIIPTCRPGRRSFPCLVSPGRSMYNGRTASSMPTRWRSSTVT
jgi:hypothetical protein